MNVLDALLFAVSLLLLAPSVVLCAEVLLASPKPAAPTPVATEESRARVTVLMPAHDEASGIAAAIHLVLPQLRPGDRLLVVADNCTDDTARIAADAGASVVERHDPTRRGKGYALDFGVRSLEAAPPEVLVILDSDCALQAGALDHLVRQCTRTQRPVQALYLMHAPPQAGFGMRMAEFAWVLKNHVRPLGLKRLGLPCQLMGTGMAFTWDAIRTAPLASGHLVEDMQLGLDLAAAGTPPLFCPEALVTSFFPSHTDGASAQRTRWEQGHLAVILSVGPRLLWRALRQGSLDLLALAVDLCVPPLAMFALLLSTGLVVSLLWAAVGGAATALWTAVLAFLLLSMAIGVAWHRFGRRLVSWSELMRAPLYVAAKVPLYIRLLTKRQTEWVRTRRDDKPH
jgi:cellulose synthase/poly-beta-1,6-N-acetylglucosamine synthase-like glycosyltransferase